MTEIRTVAASGVRSHARMILLAVLMLVYAQVCFAPAEAFAEELFFEDFESYEPAPETDESELFTELSEPEELFCEEFVLPDTEFPDDFIVDELPAFPELHETESMTEDSEEQEFENEEREFENEDAADYAEDEDFAFSLGEEFAFDSAEAGQFGERIVRTGLYSIRLEWEAQEECDYYEVFIKENGTWRRKSKLTENSVQYKALTLNSEYSYRIRPHFVRGEQRWFGPYSEEVSILIKDYSPDLECSQKSRSQVLLSWTGEADADYYELYRKVDNGEWGRHKLVYGDSASLNIVLGKTYAYKIRAHIVGEGGSFYGAYSEECAVDNSRPAMTALEDKITGFTSLTLTWDAVENCDSYEVYRMLDNSGTWTRKTIVTDCQASFELEPERSCSFKVRAHISFEGDRYYTTYSEPVSVCASLPKVSDPGLEKSGKQTVILSWEKVPYCDYYEIYRVTEKEGAWRRNIVLYEATEKEYTVLNEAFCGYRIRAHLVKDGERRFTEFSAPVFIWNAEAPQITNWNADDKELSFAWTALANADKYKIYMDGQLFDETTDTAYSCPAVYENSAFSVSAVLVFDGEELETDRSEKITYIIPVTVNYRALLIGETGYANVLNGPENDIACMSALLQGVSNTYSVVSQQNATLDEIMDLIPFAFEGAGDDDISLFYYSGHGVTGSSEYYSGALQTVDYRYLTIADLADLLSNIPGKVIVILDSCGSGAAISDGTGTKGTAKKSGNMNDADFGFDPEAFNLSVLEAFSSRDTALNGRNETDYPPGLLRAGELKQTKFHVITGSAYEENSLTTMIDNIWGGVLTRGIAFANGCSYPDAQYSGNLPADNNDDNSLNFGELSEYCKEYAADSQTVMSYSAGLDMIVFMR